MSSVEGLLNTDDVLNAATESSQQTEDDASSQILPGATESGEEIRDSVASSNKKKQNSERTKIVKKITKIGTKIIKSAIPIRKRSSGGAGELSSSSITSKKLFIEDKETYLLEALVNSVHQNSFLIKKVFKNEQ